MSFISYLFFIQFEIKLPFFIIRIHYIHGVLTPGVFYTSPDGSGRGKCWTIANDFKYPFRTR